MRLFLMLLMLTVICLKSLLFVDCGKDNKELQRLLSLPLLQDEFFAYFNTYENLKVNSKDNSTGIAYNGKATVRGLEAMFLKALNGKNVTILILGGSASQGADLGINSTSLTYHRAFTNWWSNVITPATGSYLISRLGAIGGVGTAYMSYCWREYSRKLPEVDLVTWEFNINDPDGFISDYEENLERFINSVLQFPSKPALVFLKFCKLTSFPRRLMMESHDEREEIKNGIMNRLLQKYEITDISSSTIIKNYNEANINTPILKEEYFINHHPSRIAHAQMGYALTDHVRKIFMYSLKRINAITKETTIYKESAAQKSIPNVRCYTSILPNENVTYVDSLFALQVLWYYGYKKTVKKKWRLSNATRFDVRGGYAAKKQFAFLTFLLDETILQKPSNIYIVISHQAGGGVIEVLAKTVEGVDKRTTFDCSRTIFHGISSHLVSENVFGQIELQVNDAMGNCIINTIIVQDISA